MPRPTDAGPFGEAVYAALDPLTTLDQDNGWALLLFIGAIAQMLNDLDYLAHAGPDGVVWQNIMDLDQIPDAGLPWLGQFSGVRVDTARSYTAQRQQIRDKQGFGRGTLAAFKSSVSDLLTGTKTVDVTERTNDAYTFTVHTYGDETADSTAVLNRFLANKPAGLVMTYTVLPGSPAAVTYQQMYDNVAQDNTYGDIYNSWQTYADIH